MTFEDRVKAVAGFNVTERQAQFLVTVLLHSGVCVRFGRARELRPGTSIGLLRAPRILTGSPKRRIDVTSMGVRNTPGR
jgi:hypothetical protein